MKKYFIIYSIIYLTLGGTLFSHSHHCEEDHDNILGNHECIECIKSETTTYYKPTIEKVYFHNTSSEFIVFFPPTISNKASSFFVSRAPPIS